MSEQGKTAGGPSDAASAHPELFGEDSDDSSEGNDNEGTSAEAASKESAGSAKKAENTDVDEAPARKKTKRSGTAYSKLVDDAAMESDGEGGDVVGDDEDDDDGSNDSYESDGFVKKGSESDDSENDEDSEEARAEARRRRKKKRKEKEPKGRFQNVGVQPSVGDLEVLRGSDSDGGNGGGGGGGGADGNKSDDSDALATSDDDDDDDENIERKVLQLGLRCFGPDYAAFAGMHDIDHEKLKKASDLVSRRRVGLSGSGDNEDGDADDDDEEDDAASTASDGQRPSRGGAAEEPGVARTERSVGRITKFDSRVDLPERFATGQLRAAMEVNAALANSTGASSSGAASDIFADEAEWVMRQLALRWPQHAATLPADSANVYCANILHAMVTEHLEVPYIATYRRQHAQHFIPQQLWDIQDLHCEWVALQKLSTRVKRGLRRVDDAATKALQTSSSSSSSSPENGAAEDLFVSRMVVAGQYAYQMLPAEAEELQAYLDFSDIFSDLATPARAKQVAQDAEAAAETNGVATQSGRRKKKGAGSKRSQLDSHRKFLAKCQTAGLLGLQRLLGLLPAQVTDNYEAAGYNSSQHVVANDPTPVAAALAALQEKLKNEAAVAPAGQKLHRYASADTETLLKALERCVALSLAHEPRLRVQLLRDLKEMATLDTDPTARGAAEICEDPFNEFFGVHRLRGKPVAECYYQAPGFEPPRYNHSLASSGAVSGPPADPYDMPPHSSAATAGQRKDYRNKPVTRSDTAFRGTTYARVRLGVAKGLLRTAVHLQNLDRVVDRLRRAFLTPDHYERLQRGAPLSPESVAAGWDELRERVVQRVVREYLAPVAVAQLQQRLLKESHASVAAHCAATARSLVRHQPVRPPQNPSTVTLPHPGNGGMPGGPLWVYDDVGLDDILESRRNRRASRRRHSGRRRYDDDDDDDDDDSHDDMGDDDLPPAPDTIGSVYAAGGRRDPVFFVVLDRNGDVVEKLELEAWSRHASYVANVYPKLQRLIAAHDLRVIVLNPSRQGDFVKRELQGIVEAVAEKANKPAEAAAQVVYADPLTATQLARARNAGEEEFSKEHVNLRMAVYLGRAVQDPLLEFCTVLNVAGPTDAHKAAMLSRLDLHRYLGTVPKDMLVRKVEQVLVSEVSRVGMDVHRLLNLRPRRALAMLQYIGGLGLNRASQLLAEAADRRGITNRQALAEFLPPTVFRNAAGFLPVRAWHSDPGALRTGLARTAEQIRWSDPEDYLRFHPLDATRIHPEFYARVEASLEQVYTELKLLERDDVVPKRKKLLQLLWETSNARHLRRLENAAGDQNSAGAGGAAGLDVAQMMGVGSGAAVAALQPRQPHFDPLRLSAAVNSLPNLGLQTALVFEELQWPYVDSRPAACPMSDARLYELSVGDTDESLRRGMLLPAKVTRVAYYDAGHSSNQAQEKVSGLVRDALHDAFPTRQEFFDEWVKEICNSRQGDTECKDPYAMDVLLKFLERKIKRVDVMQDIEQVVDRIESEERFRAEQRPPERGMVTDGELKSMVLHTTMRELFPFLTIRSISAQLNEGVRGVIPGRNLPRFLDLRDMFLLTMSIKEGSVLQCKVLDKDYWNVRSPPPSEVAAAHATGVAPKSPPPSLSIRCVLSCKDEDILRLVHRNDLGYQADPRCAMDEDFQRQQDYLATHTITEQFADATRALSLQEKARTITHPAFRRCDGDTAAQLLRDGVEPGTEDDGSVIFRPYRPNDNHDHRRGFKMTWKLSGAHAAIVHDFVEEQGAVVGGEGGVSEHLFVRGEVYSELDDLITNYVGRCAEYGGRMMQHRCYYHNPAFAQEFSADAVLNELKRRATEGTGSLPYLLCAAPNIGDPRAAYSFCLCYKLPGRQLTKVVIRVRPSGYVLAGLQFSDPTQLIKWWKRHLKSDFEQIVKRFLARERDASARGASADGRRGQYVRQSHRDGSSSGSRKRSHRDR